MEQPEHKTKSNNSSSSSLKLKAFIVIGVIVALTAIGFYILHNHSTENKKTEKPTQPVLKRDEPVKGQIYQSDYEDKIHEMLDSGKNVTEISRETGIRKDAIRKIKKNKAQQEK